MCEVWLVEDLPTFVNVLPFSSLFETSVELLAAFVTARFSQFAVVDDFIDAPDFLFPVPDFSGVVFDFAVCLTVVGRFDRD